jgi:cytochrome bd-I ubiquinol oxidase subunit X
MVTNCTKEGVDDMWYFSWVLGLAMAVMFGILNALWLEHKES